MKQQKYQIAHMRLKNDNYREYWENQLQEFADHFIGNKLRGKPITGICYGRTDIRGMMSITLYDDRHCVPLQKQFESREIMLGFIQGFNQAFTEINDFY